MYKVSEEALKKAYKPFDLVRFPDGELAYISEVNVNVCQESPEAQISYSVNFITENKANHKNAWYHYQTEAFEVLANIFVLIGQSACHNMGNSQQWVERILVNR